MGHSDAKKVELPDALRRQFELVEKRLWRVETTVAVGLAICALFISYFAVFFLDRLWDTHPLIRALVSLGGFVVFGFAAVRWYRNWVIRRRDRKYLATLVQRRFRRLGDRLLSIVELSDEDQHPGDYSEELYRAAIEQVAKEAEQYDFEETVEQSPVRNYKIALGALAVVLVLLFVSAPKAAVNAFQRWINPGSKVERFTLVELSGFPEEIVVPHGEPFNLQGEAKYATLWKPSEARYRFEKESVRTAIAKDGELSLDVTGVIEQGELNVKLGDAENEVQITPVHRPSLRKLVAVKTLPDYLGYPEQTQEIAGGVLSLLKGTEVIIEGEVSRVLSAAEVELDNQSARALSFDETIFKTESTALDGVFQMTFNWTDEYELKNAAPWTLTTKIVEDQPPTIQIQDFPQVGMMLETEIVEIDLKARDDYGVKETGLAIQVVNDSAEPVAPMQLLELIDTTRETDVESVFQFSPALQRIPAGSVVELQGTAVDFFPGRELSLTPVYRIHVISIEEHAEMLRERMEGLLMQLDEVSRLEEAIADATGNLSVQDPKKFEDASSKESIEELEQQQSDNARELEQVAREGMELLREALRNPAFSESALREWTENLSQMNSIANQQMQQASALLLSAANASESAPDQLDQALETEEEIINELAELRQNVNSDLDQLQAMTLAHRLRLLGKKEEAIAGNLQRIVPQTIGLLPEELSDRLKDRNENISGDQITTRDESVELREEISRFAERTRMENYQSVSVAMNDLETDIALETLAGMIVENRAMLSMQELGLWSERFNAWADLLQPPQDESGSGGGEGGGGEDEEARRIMELLISLLRLREGEVDLRVNTQLLNSENSTGDEYVEKASVLEEQQRSFALDMIDVRLDNPLEELAPVLDETQTSMKRVLDLLGMPITNEITDTAQHQTITLLSDSINLINEFIQRGGGSASSQQQQASSEQMAFLLEMMMSQGMGQGMIQNPMGGGNTSGGEANSPVTGLENSGSEGNESDERRVERGSGLSRELPVEFRDAMQNYFQAMEQEGM